MTDGFKSSNNINELRKRAEDRLKNLIESLSATTDPETKRLVHELQVHQIELEMQNEALQRLHSDAETALEKYTDLYDSAPVAYFTIDRTGTILQVNLAGARLLRKPISSLVNSRLAFYIPIENRSLFNAYLARIFEGHIRENVKTDIVTEAGDILHVQMDAIISRNDEECHIAITDDPENKLAEEAIKENNKNLKTIFDAIYESVCLINRDGLVLSVNQTFASRLGKSISDCIGQSVYDLVPADVAARRKVIIDEVIDTVRPVDFEDERQGCWLHHSISPILDSDGSVDRLAIYAVDITRRKRAETRRQVSADMFKLINNIDDFREMINSVVAYLKNWTGCEAVGIRIHEEEDYPYYETHGFPDEFVQLENRLCQYDENDEIVRDCIGNPVLECMCGNILSGRFDPSKPFFTSRGSFWTNSTSDLLASTSDADRQARTRNRCNGEGYESVALIPLRSGGEITGLIQFNDKRKDRFTLEMIGILERLGESIASAIRERQAREAQRLIEERYRTVVASTNDGIILQDRSGLILTFNKAAERIFGITAESALNQTSASYDWKTYREDGTEWPGSEHPSLHTFSTGEPCHNALMKVVRSGGDFSWVNVSTAPVFNASDTKPSAIVITITDITEKKLAEDSLQENERILNATQRLSKAGGWEWDAGTGKMTWTDEAYRIHDFDPDELTPNSPEHITRSLACYMPDDQPLVMAAFQRCIEFGESYDLEVPFITAKGRRLWIRTTAETVCINGQVAKVVGNIMDITDRKIAEEALRESEERYRLINDASQDAIYSYDLEGRFTYANRHLCAILNLSFNEIVGKTHHEIGFPEAQCREWENLHNQVYTTNSPVIAVTSTPLPDKQTHYFKVILAPIHDDKGKIVGISGTTIDITEIKQSEESLRDSEDRFRTLASLAPVGIYLCDPDGSCKYANPCWCEMAGLSIEEACGDGWINGLHPEDRSSVLSAWQQMVKSEGHWGLEYRFRTPSGKVTWVYGLATPQRDAKGNIVGYIGINTDITQRKQEEERLKLYEKIVSSAPDAISFLDKNYRYILVNDAYEKFSGVQREEFLGLTVPEYLGVNAFELHVKPNFDKCLQGETVTYDEWFDYPILGRRFVAVTYFPFCDTSGSIIGVVSNTKDITDWKHAQEALWESQEHYRSLAEDMPVYISSFLPDGTLTYVNNALAAVVDVSPKDMIGLSFFNMCDPEDMVMIKERLQSLTPENPTETHEQTNVDEDGSMKCLLWTNRAFFDENGRTIRFQAIGQDISEHRKIEHALKLSEEKFSKAFHLSPDAVNINRLKDGCYVDINLGFTDIMGYTREDVVGRSSLPGDIGLWVNVEDRNRLIEGLRNTSEVVGLEAQFRKKDGSIIIGLMSARIIEIEGEQCIISISRDITDRKRMEEELREAAMRQQAAVQAGNIGLWDWDLTTNKVTYSPEWKRQIGYEPDEISDDFDEWQSRVHPDDIGLITSQVNTYIAEARHYYQIEFRFRHKDGSYRWISAQGSVTINDTGHPIRVIGAHVDITERMRAKESLQESESRLRDIIFSVGDWVWEVDKNGVYTYSSQKGIDLFGRTSDDIIGMTPFSFMAPDEIKRVAPIFSEILLNKAPIKDLENWNITKDGERVCLLTNGVPVLDENGNLVGYRGVDKDITERKLTEQALRESEEKFAKVFRDAPVLIAISDIADGTYLEVNEYALQVSGFTCDEVIGHTSVEIGWLTAERRTLIVKEIQNKGRISDLEIDFHAKDGRVLHGLLNGEQITIGERLCLLQIAVDITERKQAEEALASSQAELKAIYDHAPVMMCVVDEDRRLIYANQPFVDFTRASEDDLIGGVACGVFGCINATDDARGCGFGDDCQNCTLWLAIDDTIKTGIAHHNVEQQATWMCDDERRNVTLLGFTTLIQSVGQKRALLCIQDITERKKQEETLIFHSMVLDQIQDQVTATDLDGVISYVNQAQEKALGVPIESLIGQSTTIFGDDPERGATQQEITETTLREGSWRGEVVNFTADGKELFMDCRTQVVHDANGKPFALCGIATDITERVQAEENRKTLVEMLDSAPGAITVHDTNGRFLYTNRNNLEIHGYTECEFIALNLHELDVPESEALLEERFRLIYEKGETSFEVSHYRKDGSIFPLMVYTKTVNWQGNLAILSIATDITERKLAEKALRESEERLKDIIFSIGDWVWEVDENGIYRYTSQRGIDLFGRSIDDVIGKTPFSFMPTDELKRIAPIFSELMAKRAPIKDLENWNLTKNGERVCLLTNAVPILDENGNFKGYRGVDKDITEKKQAEQEVYNNRLLLRTVLDIVPAHICAKNLEGRFVLVNKKLTDFYKTTVDEMTGILHSEICEDEQELKAMLAADREVIESGVQMLIPEETMQNPDGTISYLETYKLPFIANGEQAVLIVASDITQRKIAELALQDSENHYRSLVNNTPDTIMRFDRQHRHLFVNSSVENVTSITPESFIGKTHREMGFPEDLCKYWEEELDTVLQTGTPYETEFIFESQNGPRVLDWRLVPERAVSGEIESILSVSRDITDQRKVEQDYRMLFREMLDGFAVHEIICDKSGNPFDYRFLAVNPAFEQMTGLNALDTIGRTVKELMPGTEQHWIDIYGRVALSGEPVFFENYSSELHKHFEVTAFRPAPNQFACIFVDTTERKHVEQEKRQFYRDTIKSVTQGKLDLVSFEDIEVYVDPSGFLASIESPVDIAIARSKTMEFCKSRGLDNNGIGLFESAVGEAMTNATKHADGCKVYAGVNGNNIWVAVSDTGKGISTMLLPGATLRKGYSSKISMGMGYTIMMEATDNIMLCTGTEGTTVVLSVNVSSSMPALSLDDFPDTWDEISND